jgi:hypothetical protein
VLVDVVTRTVDGDGAVGREHSEVVVADHVAADGDRQRAGVAEVDAGGGRVALGAAPS